MAHRLVERLRTSVDKTLKVRRHSWVSIFILLVLLGELFDPTSNFIRVHVQADCADFQYAVDSTFEFAGTQDSNQNDTTTIEDLEIHYSFPAKAFALDIRNLPPYHWLANDRHPIDDYHPAIYHPPKHS